MNNSFSTYSSWCSSIRVIVLGDAFVTDAQVPGRVPLVCHAVVVNSVVGQRFNLGQITKKKKNKEENLKFMIIMMTHSFFLSYLTMT